MSQETFVVAFEGHDNKVLDYAAKVAERHSARLIIVHILEWSPYTFLTPEELAERHKRRTEELAVAKAKIIEPAIARVKQMGIDAEGELRYGNVVDLVTQIAKDVDASMIFVGRSGANSVAARIFGSVPLGLAQIAPVPTVIVP